MAPIWGRNTVEVPITPIRGSRFKTARFPNSTLTPGRKINPKRAVDTSPPVLHSIPCATYVSA